MNQPATTPFYLKREVGFGLIAIIAIVAGLGYATSSKPRTLKRTDAVRPNPTGLSATDESRKQGAAEVAERREAVEDAQSGDVSDRAVPAKQDELSMRGKRAGDVRQDNLLEMSLIWCEPNAFQMGSPLDEPRRRANEGPVAVELTQGYWLGQYEVTQGQWQALMQTEPSAFSASGRAWDRVRDMDTKQLPVESITWEEAMSFCDRLTEVEQKAGRLPAGWKYTLPTEPQWENACRAGQSDPTAYGETLSSRQANFNGYEPYNGADYGPSLGRTVRVGSYPPNAWGFYDIQGNVWEHCHNWYSDPPVGGTDPAGPEDGTLRVSRGGSWWGGGWNSRCSFRYWFSPEKNDWGVGFRVALCRGR